MTFTHKLDLDILPLDLHGKIQVSTSVFGWDSETDGQTHDVKTMGSETFGVKVSRFVVRFSLELKANHGQIEISNSRAPNKNVSIEWALILHL